LANRLASNTVPSDRLFQILKDLRAPANADFGPDMIRRVADLSNADILIWAVTPSSTARFASTLRCKT